MTTSALKSASMAPPPDVLGADEVYATQYQKAMDAEKKLIDLLEQKQTRNVSPSWLAFAGEMLDPGRTGSFGEALGRAAKGYATTQREEQKQLMEDAAMAMQLQQMKLDRALQAQGLKQFSTMMGGQGAVGAEGQPAGDASGPALNVRGMTVTPDMISKLYLTNPRLAESLEKGYKLKLDAIATQPNYIIDKLTGQAKPLPGQEPKAEPVPEVGGTLLMPPSDAQALRDARAKGDAKKVYQIIDLYQKGVGPRPTERVSITEEITEGAPGQPPARVTPRGADMTIEGRQIQTAKDKAAAEKFASTQAENTVKFLSNADDMVQPRTAATDNINILSRNPKIVGYLNKPGVGNAIFGLIQDSLRVGAGRGTTGVDVNIANTDLQTALMKVDPKLKLTEQDLTDLGVLTSNLARLELGLRRTRPPGEGSMSNIEGQPYKDIVGNRYDTADALMKKMKLAARAFDYEMDKADAFRKFDEVQGGNKTYEEFKRTKEYKQLSNEYETWLNKNMGIPFRKKSGTKASLNANDIIDVAKKRGLIK